MDSSVGILLVDDDEVDVMHVQRSFRRNRIKNPIHVAGNGIEALKFLRTEGSDESSRLPKLILLDINMPRMNGIEFLQELRADARLKHLTVIILTTSSEDRDILASYALNVAGYLLKPVDMCDFMKAVTALDTYWSLCLLP